MLENHGKIVVCCPNEQCKAIGRISIQGRPQTIDGKDTVFCFACGAKVPLPLWWYD